MRCCKCGWQLSVEIKEATLSILAEGVAQITWTQHSNGKRKWKSPACVLSSVPSVFFINSVQMLARTLNTSMHPLWKEEGNSNKLGLIFIFFFPITSSSHFCFSKILLHFFFTAELKLTGNKEHRLFPFSRNFKVFFSTDSLVFTCNTSEWGFNQTCLSWGQKWNIVQFNYYKITKKN